jgi:hypothetical protein
MFGKLVGAALGRRIAGRRAGGRGLLLGALAPVVARRAFGPLGLALAGGYVAKKVWDRRRARREAAPAEAAAAAGA